ncbi:MAG: Crp/Fnr family transcriptional regulator [Paramuribaculum sp.]|nr:Crp/Fnr family transcriptional regulator [Paramuribaculum sp.]MDE6324396.1 Crp/Fnr family transcriptional regulator [Paramuribaculum sp.]MDE6487754.1 Crp/Fnr family transcriptional regulator [Paramuribaculum sp.]
MSHPIDEIKTKEELTPEFEAAFRELIAERPYRKGDTISAMNDMRSHLFYIMSGSARVYYISGGKEHTYSFAFENEYISLSYPLLKDSDYVTTIEFLEPTLVATVPIEKIQLLLRQYDPVSIGFVIKEMIKGMMKQMSMLEERILVLQTYSAKEKFEWMVNRYPKILERANLTQIASYLGVTKETLYRIRSGKYRGVSPKK